MKKKQGSSVIYIIFMLVVILAFCAFAVDATIIYSTRAKLQNATESTALAAASTYNRLTMPDDDTVQKSAQNIFNLFKVYDLAQAQITNMVVSKSATTGNVLIETKDLAPTYFLAFIGVPYVELNARASAISEELTVTANYVGGINWITAASAYLSDIISEKSNVNYFHDTAILQPLGGGQSASIDATTGVAAFSNLGADDGGQSLSLGPGGFITIKLPAPIIDKDGPDLFIQEAGAALEGYMVFVGLDVDPTDPYTNNSKQGKGIYWVNISLSGQTSVNGFNQKPNGTAVTINQDKFYGSGYFDIGSKLLKNPLGMAKYLRIIDDNDESAYAKTIGGDYKYVQMYGEASTPVSGADIDFVKVLNHVRLTK